MSTNAGAPSPDPDAVGTTSTSGETAPTAESAPGPGLGSYADAATGQEWGQPDGWVQAEAEGWASPEGWIDDEPTADPAAWDEGWHGSQQSELPDAAPEARTQYEPGPGWRVLQRFLTPLDGHRGDSRPLYAHGLMFDVDRYSCIIPEHHAVSFGSYFNAFPASYWRRWTDIESVRLRLKVRGNGKVTVFRSTSAGRSWCERNVVFEGPDAHEVMIELPLIPFIDGGWYWFDLLAFGGNDVVLEEGDWSGRTDTTARGRVSVGITTFNRPDFCVEQIRNLGAHEALLQVLDTVYVIDQGDQRVVEHAEFDAAAETLGDKLRVIEQKNLGGSGGFARAMFETLAAADSDYLLLLDDDVVAEPEGINRAVTFADLSRVPVLVGGHMFSIFVRSVLHAFGEAITKYRWMWGPAPHTQHSHDFGAAALAHTPWLHRRIDVDYNGWWMCLIPTKVLRDIGLALPMFIKWDDAEFGLRASSHGYPTVTLPGVAVWHVPWHDKDDTIDWQAYFHERNRLLSALLHSPYERGGSLLRESFQLVIKHSLAMHYAAAEMVLQAIEDLLEGPQHLHRDIGRKIDDLRALRARFDDSRYASSLQQFPPLRTNKPPRRGRLPQPPKSSLHAVRLAARLLPRQLTALDDNASLHPLVALPQGEQQWWRLAQYGSVLASSADGSSAVWLRRDPDRFRSIMLRNTQLHARLYRDWRALSRIYGDAVPALASPEAWQETFHAAAAPNASSRLRPPTGRAAANPSSTPDGPPPGRGST